MPRARAVIIAPLAVLAAATLLLALPGQASAKSCANQIIDDWTQHGYLTRTYPVHCYREALNAVPEDLRDYSNITDVINAALQDRLHPGKGGSTGGPGGSGGTSGSKGEKKRTLQVAPPQSYYRRAIDNLGTTSADSVPIPLLVLASLGGLLLLTAGGLVGAKRIRALRARSKPPGS